MVQQFLQEQQRTAACPDYTYLTGSGRTSRYRSIAPVITTIFNRSLIKGTVGQTSEKKQMYYHALASSLEACNQLRPISLTAAIIVRLFERCVHKTKLYHVSEFIALDRINSLIRIKVMHNSTIWPSSNAIIPG